MNSRTNSSLSDKLKQQAEDRFRRVLQFDQKPAEIAASLRDRVIGQDAACEAFVVRLRQHLLQTREMFVHRHLENKEWRSKDLGGMLVLGPTGCGKTHLMHTLTELSLLIFHMEDATGLTETGYVGRDISDIGRAIVRSASGHRPLSPSALVFLDEVDKLRSRPDAVGKDITGTGVQRSLLALLDGMSIDYDLDERRSRNHRLQTDAMFVVLGGAFAGLDQIIARRTRQGKSRLGFGQEQSAADQAAEHADLMGEVTAEDLVEYGFMPEMVGRLRDFIVIRPLDTAALTQILLHPEHGPLAAYQKMAAAENFQFELTEELVGEMVASSKASGQGARVLRRVMAKATRRALFEVPSLSHRRGAFVVRLGLAALQDGSYEIVSRRSSRRQEPSQEEKPLEDALHRWLEGKSKRSTDGGPGRQHGLERDIEPLVPEALEEDGEQIGTLIGAQAEAEGYIVEVEVEVRMWANSLQNSKIISSTPAARVTLWVRNEDPKLPPPDLHGGRLRSYARRANIETSNWDLLNGARSCGTHLRPDGKRWRRHELYLALKHKALRQFLPNSDQDDNK